MSHAFLEAVKHTRSIPLKNDPTYTTNKSQNITLSSIEDYYFHFKSFPYYFTLPIKFIKKPSPLFYRQKHFCILLYAFCFNILGPYILKTVIPNLFRFKVSAIPIQRLYKTFVRDFELKIIEKKIHLDLIHPSFRFKIRELSSTHNYLYNKLRDLIICRRNRKY